MFVSILLKIEEAWNSPENGKETGSLTIANAKRKEINRLKISAPFSGKRE